jgi:hypothetical protein
MLLFALVAVLAAVPHALIVTVAATAARAMGPTRLLTARA